MRESITARCGAEFLDERVPGWAELIDLDTFDLESTARCVLGQIEGARHPRRGKSWERYDQALDEFGISWSDARRLGFIGMDSGLVGRTWRRLIQRRQRHD